jgi:hypothetical protein
MMNYGKILFSGVAISDKDVDLYNKLTMKIENCSCQEEKSFLLSERHQHFTACAYP